MERREGVRKTRYRTRLEVGEAQKNSKRWSPAEVGVGVGGRVMTYECGMCGFIREAMVKPPVYCPNCAEVSNGQMKVVMQVKKPVVAVYDN